MRFRLGGVRIGPAKHNHNDGNGEVQRQANLQSQQAGMQAQAAAKQAVEEAVANNLRIIMVLQDELAKEETELTTVNQAVAYAKVQAEELLKHQLANKQRMTADLEAQLAEKTAKIANVEHSYACLESKVKELDESVQVNEEGYKAALAKITIALETIITEKEAAIKATQEANAARQTAEGQIAQLQRELDIFTQVRIKAARRAMQEWDELSQASDLSIRTMPPTAPWIRGFEEHVRRHRVNDIVANDYSQQHKKIIEHSKNKLKS